MNVKLARIKKGLTQRQLRCILGISTNKLSAIENGNLNNVTYELMNRIAEVLDSTPQKLFFEGEWD